MKKSYNLITIIALQVILACFLSGSLYSQGSVSGVVRYNDNNEPVTNGTVKAYDTNGLEIASTLIQSDGSYLLLNLPPIQLDMIGLVDDEWGDFIATFHPNKEDWQNAIPVIPLGVLINSPFAAHITGSVTLNGAPLKDAFVYAQVDGISQQYGKTDASGRYIINNLSQRDYILVVHRIGCTSSERVVNVTYPGLEMIDFSLEKVSKPNNSSIIKDFKLAQNYPNPFNPTTKISFSLPSAGFVNLTVYNVAGQVVKELVNEQREAGSYLVEFDGTSLSSGVYYYRLESKGYAVTRKMTLVK
jgi:hypothetical protein